MQYKDYYRILGVTPQSTDEEIKKAFKRLAVKYHPDTNPGNPLAEEKFKEIGEARKILLDPNLRFRYDQIRNQGRQATGGFTGPVNGEVNNVFSTFFEEIFGGRKFNRKGKNYEANMSITLEEAYHGMEDVLKYEGRRIRLKIKPGIQHSQTLRIKGQGGPGRVAGDSGDLYLSILIKPHNHFVRKENDLHLDMEISIFDLILGNKITVPSFRGNMSVVVPPGTQSGEKLKLKGLGMPIYESSDKYGDLYIGLNIRSPKKLSPKQRALWQQLADLEKKRARA